MSLLDTLKKSKVIPEVNITSLNTELDYSKELLENIQETKKKLLDSFVHTRATHKKVQDQEIKLKEIKLHFDTIFVGSITDKSMPEIIQKYCAGVKKFSDSVNAYNAKVDEYNTEEPFLILKSHSSLTIEKIDFNTTNYLHFLNGTKINNYNTIGNATTLLDQDCLGEAI